jgi:cathepsin X
MFLLPLAPLLAASPLHHGHRVNRAARTQPLILTALPSSTLADSEVPSVWDWRNLGDGVSMVTADVNQHIPVYCGSCWIHGTLAALNDRIKIARRGAFPDVMISRQAAMNCVPSLSTPEDAPPGCNGGDPWDIHTYLAHSPLPDETCQPYEAKNGVCDAANQCRNCFHPSMIGPDAPPEVPAVEFASPGCFAVDPGPLYGVREFGGVKGELDMQKEIFARGPIVCSIAADLTFLLAYEQHLVAGNVYVDPSYFPEDGSPSPHNETEIDHDVEITGWGTTEAGVPYWVARNSWGSYWGERGWFKILRGANHLFIESDCQWAVPDVAPLEANLASHLVGDYVDGKQRAAKDEEVPGLMGRIHRQIKRQKAQRQAKASASVMVMQAADVQASAPPPDSDEDGAPSRGAGASFALAAAGLVAAGALMLASGRARGWRHQLRPPIPEAAGRGWDGAADPEADEGAAPRPMGPLPLAHGADDGTRHEDDAATAYVAFGGGS